MLLSIWDTWNNDYSLPNSFIASWGNVRKRNDNYSFPNSLVVYVIAFLREYSQNNSIYSSFWMIVSKILSRWSEWRTCGFPCSRGNSSLKNFKRWLTFNARLRGNYEPVSSGPRSKHLESFRICRKAFVQMHEKRPVKFVPRELWFPIIWKCCGKAGLFCHQNRI